MKTIEIAEVFVVDVINEGGCVCVELGGDYADLATALREAKSITRKQARDAGAYNNHGLSGVNVTITAGTKDGLDIASDGCTGSGLVIYNRWL